MSLNTSQDFTGRIPHFFDLLGKQATSIPIQSQWVLMFDSFPAALINQVSQYESFFNNASSNKWTINGSVAIAIGDHLQFQKGCIFAQSVIMPPEGVETDRAGEYNGAYIKGLLTKSRIDFGTFDVSFLETNLSFVDTVLRPWSIMATHRSLIARPDDSLGGNSVGNNSIKTNITVYHLAKAGAILAPKIRKQFNFYDCVPVGIDSDEYSSEGERVLQRNIKFLYSYYTLDSPSNWQ